MVILYQFRKLLYKVFPYFILFLAEPFKRLIDYLLLSLINLTYSSALVNYPVLLDILVAS